MTARPTTILKLATSLDGRIATAAGESRWITGPAAREEVHRLRAEADAVLIGTGTALADDPELTARLGPPAAKQPLRVVLDSRLRLPLRSKLIATIPAAPLAVLAVTGADKAAQKALEDAGAQVVFAPGLAGRVDLDAALSLLQERFAVRSVLIESGGKLAASFVKARLVDRLEWVRGPILLGAEGRPAIDQLEIRRLADAPAFKRVAVREFGPDLWESYERV